MQQRRIPKSIPPSSSSTANLNARSAGQQSAASPSSNANHDEKTLPSLVEAIERLTVKVSKLEEVQSVWLVHDRKTHPRSWFDRVVNGKPGVLFALVSSAITVLPVLSSVGLGLLKRAPVLTGTSPAVTVAAVLRPVIPEAIAIALAAALIVASRWLHPRSIRLKVAMSVMLCYGAATAFYLAWLSLAFLQYQTLPSGVLLTLTWVGIVSILRRAPTEIIEMQEMVQAQVNKEAKQREILP